MIHIYMYVYRMKNNRKIKDVMTEMVERTGRRGRPCREWMDDITDWCQTDVHRLSLLAQDRDTGKNDYEICIGHLLALCPWIMMMTMILCVHIHYIHYIYIFIYIYTYIYTCMYTIIVYIYIIYIMFVYTHTSSSSSSSSS